NNLWPSAAMDERSRFNQYGTERRFATLLEIAGKFRLKDYIRETAIDTLTNVIVTDRIQSKSYPAHPFLSNRYCPIQQRVEEGVSLRFLLH
ncbi:hypothetical protein WUBG_15216, partial [Wuchereria bancrofti]